MAQGNEETSSGYYRAHAYIKADKFEQAKEDADKSIQILRARDPSSSTLAKAFLRSGVASFHLGRFSEARNCFVEGQKLGEEAGLKQWLTWCDEKIAKFGPGPGAIKKQEEAKKESEASKMDTTPTTAAAVSLSSEAVPQQDPQAMPVPKISHDWYQTETQVVVEVRIKKLKADECKIEIGETSLSVTAPLPTGSEYSLELDLAHPVVPAQSG